MADPKDNERSSVAPTRTELVWPGKRTQVDRVALPFQVVETVNQSRATREKTPLLAGLPPPPLFEGQQDSDASLRQAQGGAWKNKLIWGENKYVLASLLQGDPSIGLEPLAGKVDLIYIDPPFATGQRFSYPMRIGDAEWVKEASIIEETAYRDTWGRGLDSYLQMMYERLVLMRELLAEEGNIWVHLDDNLSPYIKVELDSLFGEQGFVNQIVWRRVTAHGDRRGAGRIHDVLLWYARNPSYYFNQPGMPLRDEYVEQFYRYAEADGRRYRLVSMNAKGAGPARRFGNQVIAPPAGTHWRWGQERIDRAWEAGLIVITEGGAVHYKQYLEEHPYQPVQSIWDDKDVRYLGAHSTEHLGFETQKPEGLLARIVKMCSRPDGLIADFFSGSGTTMAVAEKLGRRWIGCDLSRYAIQVSRKRLLDIPDCKPFQVLNLGKYERKHWQVNVLNGRQGSPDKAIADYYRFILSLYHAELVGGYAHLHGHVAGRWVHVGAADAPVTRAQIMEAIRECQANRYTALDVLGWEWEMGLHDTVRDEAKRMGVDLRLLVIPREVMDKRAVQSGDVHFYELAYLKTLLLQDSRTITVKLEDFIIPNPDLVPDEVRTKIKKWSDYIDFWAVDWNYQSDTFHNQWQTYRTRKDPTLPLISFPNPYTEAGPYRILVKVIDIFGNDTTQLLEVAVP